MTLSHGILIIENAFPPACLDEHLSAVSPECESAGRVSWERFSLADLRNIKSNLIVANAVPGSVKALEFFELLKSNRISVPVFAILPSDDPALLQVAIETVDDFLFWPARGEEFRQRIGRLMGTSSRTLSVVQEKLTVELGMQQIVGRDPAFMRAMEKLACFGAIDTPVLLTGETGTGKELCARVTHLLSKRSKGPFIPVDCGALPDHLFENEVFGHARGAYTDARSAQKGLVAIAQGGTLFLDEIDSLSLTAQSKLLRLLQEHTYRPLGSEVFKQADVRIIAATNRNLDELVSKKTFRSDLYFRINVLRIHLPALRNRKSDVALLSRHFIDEICMSLGVSKKFLSAGALRRLELYTWPGNVRELYNVMQRAVLCSMGTQISSSAIELNVANDPEEPAGTENMRQSFRYAKQQAIRCFERDYVTQLMDKHDGNVTRAAREAGKDRRAFGRLASKYRLPTPSN